MSWYCEIAVKGIKKLYYYISDLGFLEVDTLVVVPFGKDNEFKIGRVATCVEYPQGEEPYPPEHTKHIVRLAYKFETKNDEEQSDLFLEVDRYLYLDDWDQVFDWANRHASSKKEKVIHKVMSCYEECRKHGNPVAALKLGIFYHRGDVVEQDYHKAFELFKEAADYGVVRAICNCGYYYYYGLHQEVDYEQAYHYFSLGVFLENDTNCFYKLGDMYLHGYAVEENEHVAFLLYSRAVIEANDHDEEDCCLGAAQMRLGKCFLYGIGVDQDPAEAYALLSMSLLNYYHRLHSDGSFLTQVRLLQELLKQANDLLSKTIDDPDPYVS